MARTVLFQVLKSLHFCEPCAHITVSHCPEPGVTNSLFCVRDRPFSRMTRGLDNKNDILVPKCAVHVSISASLLEQLMQSWETMATPC